jgi:T5SS/PEP-CTERM-associated repeat protein
MLISRIAHRNNLGFRPAPVYRYLSAACGTFALLSALSAPDARAADKPWRGRISNAWTNDENWGGGQPGANELALFGATSATSVSLAGSASVGGLHFLFDASAYTVASAVGSRSLLILGTGGIRNDGGVTQTIGVPIALSADAGITTSPAGAVTNLTGSLALNTHRLTVSGAGNTNLLGTVTGNTGTGTTGAYLTKNGTGTLTLASANNNIIIVGDTNLNGGTIALNGGKLSNTQTLVGNGSNTGGTLSVSGVGSQWTSTLLLSVATTGTGALSISNGGIVNSRQCDIGRSVGSSGSATVTGVNSQLLSDTGIRVGYGGTGTLNITNGGTVRSAAGTLGADAGGTGTVIIDGVGSQWVAPQAIGVGGSGTGTLSITNGGAMTSDQLYIGTSAKSTGTVTVDGANSEVKDVLFLYVGNSGSGTLNITNGGTVRVGVSSIGALSGSSGSATVDGPNSQWVNTSSFSVGDNGTGTLRITNGGTLTSRDSYIGSYPGSSGKVTVEGVNSRWTVSADPLYVAYDGTGTLDITNGGTVQSKIAYIGYATGASGTVNVGGANSQWINDGTLSIGEAGMGALAVTNGGNVSANKVMLYAGSSLTVGSGATLEAADALESAGEASIGTAAEPGGTVQGNVLVVGRTLTNNGMITGFTTVESGTAKGAGNYAGGYSVQDGGRILFGNSPGLLSSGSATWNGGGSFVFQINDATGVAGVNWGQNAITGTLTVAASAANPFTVRLESLLKDDTSGALLNFDPSASYAWDVVTTTGGIAGFDASAFFLDASAFTLANPGADSRRFQIAQSGNALRVSYAGASAVVVPEASAGLLALLAAPGLLLLRNRRAV